MATALWSVVVKVAELDTEHVFLRPVDLNAVPNYLSFVSRPLDLCTIAAGVQCEQYGGEDDVWDDVSQMLVNCVLFNGDDAYFTPHAIRIAHSMRAQMSPDTALPIESNLAARLLLARFAKSFPGIANAFAAGRVHLEEARWDFRSIVHKVESGGGLRSAVRQLQWLAALVQILGLGTTTTSESARWWVAQQGVIAAKQLGLPEPRIPSVAPEGNAMSARLSAVICQLERLDTNGVCWYPELSLQARDRTSLLTMRMKAEYRLYAETYSEAVAQIVADLDHLADQAVDQHGPESTVASVAASLRRQVPLIAN
jgi:hypothetical protein